MPWTGHELRSDACRWPLVSASDRGPGPCVGRRDRPPVVRGGAGGCTARTRPCGRWRRVDTPRDLRCTKAPTNLLIRREQGLTAGGQSLPLRTGPRCRTASVLLGADHLKVFMMVLCLAADRANTAVDPDGDLRDQPVVIEHFIFLLDDVRAEEIAAGIKLPHGGPGPRCLATRGGRAPEGLLTPGRAGPRLTPRTSPAPGPLACLPPIQGLLGSRWIRSVLLCPAPPPAGPAALPLQWRYRPSRRRRTDSRGPDRAHRCTICSCT